MEMKCPERADKQLKQIAKGDKEIEQDRKDYYSALQVKLKNKKCKPQGFKKGDRIIR